MVHTICECHLSELCVPVASASGRQHLRSASTGRLQVLRARTTIRRRSFAVAGPSLWNTLPAALRRPQNDCTLLRDNWRPTCYTSDVLVNRRNIHHRPALLWRCSDSGAGYKTADLLIYLLTYFIQFQHNTHPHITVRIRAICEASWLPTVEV